MAATKKSSTSKTARVMNLLSKNREEPAELEMNSVEEAEVQAAPVVPAAAPEPAAPVAAPAPVSHPTTPPLISSMQADSAISDQVLSALENALDDELKLSSQEATAANAEPAATATVQEAAPAQADVIQDAVADAITQITEAEEAVVEAAESPAVLVAQTTAPAQENENYENIAHTSAQSPVDRSTIYVNVMEALVEEKAKKYIDLFGLCKCPRCVADIKALTLNRLEPKYVVMRTGDVIPRITLYEGQFSASVTAQLLTACKLVMEHPRHDRE